MRPPNSLPCQASLKIKDTEVSLGGTQRVVAPLLSEQRGSLRKKIPVVPDEKSDGHKVIIPEAELAVINGVGVFSDENRLLAQADIGVASDATVGVGSGMAPDVPLSGALGSSFSSTSMAIVAAGVAGIAGAVAIAGSSQSKGADSSSPTQPPTVADTSSPLFSSSSHAVVAENTANSAVIYRAQATDNLGVTGYSLAGGVDDEKFTLDVSTGELRFKVSPDFEAPASAAGSHAYRVKIRAADAAGNNTVQELTIEVTDVDDTAPVFASATTVSIAENTTASAAVYRAQATDNVAVTGYALAGGSDDDKFTFDTATGELRFKLSPDYETPGSAANSNSYTVKIKAVDAAGNEALRTVAVNVTDVAGAEVSGSITAGPVVASGLLVQVQSYGANGWANLGAPVEVDANGNYRLHLTDGYAGAFRLSVLDGNGSQQPDYLDEATGQLKNIGELNLVAYADVSKATPMVANITPLTTLAGSLASDALAHTNDAELQKSVVDNSGLAVAKMFGLPTDVALHAQTPLVVVSPTGQAVQGNAYGAALAVVSGIEQANGQSTLAVVTALKAGVSVDLYYAGMSDLQIGIDPSVQIMLQQGHTASQTLLQSGGNQVWGDQVLQSCTNLVLQSANLVFANMGLHRVGDSSGAIGAYGDTLGETGGYYRTMFELAAASYVHPDVLSKYPGMTSNDPDPLGAASLLDLREQGVSFSISATDLHLGAASVNGPTPNEGAFFANGYYVAFDKDYLDRSSVALLGRSKDALFLVFRGTDGGLFSSDGWDDLSQMESHYNRYQPLFDGVDTYLSTHPEITKVYVGGHSLGGQMASEFMTHHPNDTRYAAVTFEAADKYFSESDSGQVGIDGRVIRFEMEKDLVPDLSNWNYGKGILVEGDPDWDAVDAHKMGNIDKIIDPVFRALEKPENIPSALYVDDSKDGVIVTDAEELQAGYGFNTDFGSVGGILVIRALDSVAGGIYSVTETNVQTVILNNADYTNINLDARLADHYVNLVGNDANNILRASATGSLLVGMGGEDILLGGAGRDILVGSKYGSLLKVAVGDVQWDKISGYVNGDLPDGVSYIRGGAGSDTIYCSSISEQGAKDYVFCDVDGRGEIDTVIRFSPNDLLTPDYLVFSMAQLGIAYNSVDDIADKKFSQLLGAEVWDVEATNFQIGSSYDYDLNSGEDTFYIQNGSLYFDPSGENGQSAYALVKLQDVFGGINGIDGANILLVKSFDELDFGSTPISNHAPSGSVTITGALAVGQTLTAANALQDQDGLGVISYVWQSSSTGTNAWGNVGSGSSFALTADQQDKYMRVVAQYTDGHGTVEAVVSTVGVTHVAGAAESTVGGVYNGHTYMLTSTGMTWNAAEAEAVSKGGHLVTVNDQAEQNWLIQTFGNAEDLWVGLNDAALEGHWVWSSGEASTYTNWSPWEPNSAGGDEDYVHMIAFSHVGDASYQGGWWNDNIETTTWNPRGVVELPAAPNVYTPGQSSIDLGEYGKLIAPIHADDHWYYFWDRSGDGVASGGAWDGTQWVNSDWVNHNTLDTLFHYAGDFAATSPIGETDTQIRYATLNGVKVALPTVGESSPFVGVHYGTALDNEPAGEVNPNYDDLLAIKDALDGWGGASHEAPAGWAPTYYWAADAVDNGHYKVNLGGNFPGNTPGYVMSDMDSSSGYVALQVL